MLANDPLEGLKLKLERADSHIKELARHVNEFCDGQKYTSRIVVEPDGQQALKVIFDLRPIPGIIPVIVGDTLFQLRSTFDHLACLLAIQNGAKKTSDVCFPTGNNVNHFVSESQKKIHRLSEDAKSMISALEPYDGGKGDWIRVIHTTNIIDKHQALIPIAATAFPNASVTFMPQLGLNTISGPEFHSLVENEMIVMKFPAGATNIQGNLAVTLDIAFGKTKGVEGERILRTLMIFSSFTKEVVSNFEERFFV